MKTSWGAQIVTLDEFAKLHPKLGKIVATSGGYDPIHPGHISLIIDSKRYGDTMVVIVNGDWFLTAKKGKPFQNLATRSLIVSGIKNVDYVIPFEIEGDTSVVKALEIIKPHIFTKGGDRNTKTLPPEETEVCKKNNIEVIFGVGEDKEWSSSWFTNEWSKSFHKRAVNKTKHKLKNKLSKYLET